MNRAPKCVAPVLAVYLEDLNDDVQLVLHICCNLNGIITYCHIDNGNSFDSTPLGKIINGENGNHCIPDDCYLIGDCSFPLHKNLITPFRLATTDKKREFNTNIDSIVAVATGVFKKIFKRFHTLFALEAYNIDEVRKIITTLCILHNLCQKYDDRCVLEDSDFEIGQQFKLKINESDQAGLGKRIALMENFL